MSPSYCTGLHAAVEFPATLVSMAPETDCRVGSLLQSWRCRIVFATLRNISMKYMSTGIRPERPLYTHSCTCYLPRPRHVILPKDVASNVPPGRLMSEAEWRKLGVQQSRGWVHYMVHKPGRSNIQRSACITFLFLPEPHILLFRRPKQT